MSKRTIETTKTSTYKQTIRKCDLCGAETKPGHDWDTATYYGMDETEINCKTGEVYPDGDDNRTTWRLDLCPKCFVDKFVPAVEQALGVKFEKVDGW